MSHEKRFEPRSALVTGGAGFIGSHIVDALLAQGVEVVVVDDLSVGNPEHVPAGARLIQADIRDAEALGDALSGVDVVFHEAARVSVRGSMDRFHDDADNNVMGTLSLLRSCSAHGTIRKLVLASSMAVYADAALGSSVDEQHRAEPLSPYGVGKLAAEKYCLQLCPRLGIEPVVLRYFNTYGTRQTLSPYVGVVTIFVRGLLAGRGPTVFGDGRQTRDFVSVRDIVQANLKAMDRAPGGTLCNVGSGRGTTVRRLAELLIERLAPESKIEFAPVEPGELRCSVANLDLARRQLGYEPESDFEADLNDIIEYHRARDVA